MTTSERTATNAHLFFPRLLPWCYGFLLALTIFFWGAFLLRETNLLGYVFRRDFCSVYVGAQIVEEGHGAQLYNLELQRNRMDADILPYQRSTLLPFIYPGYVAVFLSPLAKIPLGPAFLLWTGINLLITAWIARRLLWNGLVSARLRFTVLLAILIWIPLQLTLSHGQMGLLCALGFTEALAALRDSEDWQAGIWLVLGLFKPQLLILPLLLLILCRRWRTIASFLAAALIVLTVSVAKLGFWFVDYLHFISSFNRGGGHLSLYPSAMQNWRGLVALLFGSDRSLAAQILLAALSIASVGLVIFLSYHQPPRPTDNPRLASALPENREIRFAIAICLGILSSPYLYGHDWVVAIPALVIFFSLAERLGSEPGQPSGIVPTMGWLISLAPLVSFATQFGVWPQSTHIQLLPLYMGVLTGFAVLGLQKLEAEPIAPLTTS